MLTRIVTFYQGNIPRSVVSAQAAVFKKFGQHIEQVLTHLDHGPAIDEYINRSTFDVLLIFDVDCIPLNDNVIPEAIEIVTKRPCLYGIRQNANHVPGSADYVAPAFVCFSRHTFQALGCPSFRAIRGKGDVGSQLTYRAMGGSLVQYLLSRPPIEVRFIDVSEVVIPIWSLKDGTRYGTGTNYENKIFHAFGVGGGGLGMKLFLSKAAEIVGESTWSSSTSRAAPAMVNPTFKVPAYVISSPNAEDKRRAMAAHLEKLGIPFRFVDGFDGSTRPVSDQVDGAQVLREVFSTENEMASAASHRVVHRMISEGDSKLALVLEGDAQPLENFPEVLTAATKLDFDVLKVEGKNPFTNSVTVGVTDGYRFIVRKSASFGSGGYLITRSAAARFCHLPLIDQNVDAAFNDFRLRLRVVEVQPFPVIQNAENPRVDYTRRFKSRARLFKRLARSVRKRHHLVQVYGFQTALLLEIQRFRRK
jgi:GR25 family glycosyltransferase involved in LPS biosynthesis